MTRIICRVTACVFWEQGECNAEQIEYELDDGCLTFQAMGDLELEGEADDLDWEDEEDAGLFDDDDDDWDDDDEWDKDLGL